MRVLCWLTLAAQTVLAQSPLAILTNFDKPASSVAMAAMRNELARIMLPLGWDLEWHGAANAPQNLPRFVVLSFKGVCRVQTGFIPEQPTDALATTEVNGTHILPFSNVECNQVRKLLPGLLHNRESELVLGKALGRVVAHELYHFLLQTKKHAVKGIADSYQTTRELTAAEFRFDELSSRVLKHQAETELQRSGAQSESVQRAGVLPEIR